MTRAEALIAECASRGVRLLPTNQGGLTIDAPKSVMTADLIGKVKSLKAELLEKLQTPKIEEAPVESNEAESESQHIDPDSVPACPKCQLQEMWQSIAGTWRCMNCEPPTATWRLLEHAERIRRQSKQYESHRTNCPVLSKIMKWQINQRS